MKTKVIFLFTLLAVFCSIQLPSCVDPKDVVYLQDVEYNKKEKVQANRPPIIQVDDELSVSISSKQPSLTAVFTVSDMGGGRSSSHSYAVDRDGYIILPIIGKVKAAGKTCIQLGEDISRELKEQNYIQDASVDVQITNFKFCVLGEAGGPGHYQITGSRITILEAISKAGDLSLDALRTVTVIRESNGYREIGQVDLRSKDLFKSPYYYIQQNDIIYTRPVQRKLDTRSSFMQYWGWGASLIGFIISVVALAA